MNIRTSSLPQPVLRFEPSRDIFLGDVADVLRNQGFHFHFEAVGEHFFDLLLPLLVFLEPGVRGNLLGAFDVAIIE